MLIIKASCGMHSSGKDWATKFGAIMAKEGWTISNRLRVALFPSKYASDSWVIGRDPFRMLYLGLWSPQMQVPSCWSHVCVATCPSHPLVRQQVPNKGIKKLSACLPTGLRFSISGVISSWAVLLDSTRQIDCAACPKQGDSPFSEPSQQIWKPKSGRAKTTFFVVFEDFQRRS